MKTEIKAGSDFEPIDLEVWDCAQRHYDGSTLKIVGGVGASMWHCPTLTLLFREVAYIECPVLFSHPTLRQPTADERAYLERREAIGDDDAIFVLEAESMGDLDSQPFYVVAESLEIERSE